MKKYAIILCSLFLFSSGLFSSDTEKPKLVVGIVVDQMRQEYLYRFYDKFGDEGFKKLMTKGFMLKNAHLNYVPTFTGPGHASLYTGTTPRVHGIIANSWFVRKSGDSMYCAGDSTVKAVGGTPEAGKISARNMLSTTITDELGLFFQNRSKIIAVSIKDRGAALPAGHNPTGAYWYDSKTGEFMSSSYYVSELPDWVNNFNEQKWVEKYMSQPWETSYPIEGYVESGEDNRSGEANLAGKDSPTFPYDLPEMSKVKSAESLIRSTPFGNSIVKEMALAAIDGESMGQDDVTDFLAISFSSTDYIGHVFGPYSKEIEDTYIKLDEDLAELLKTLDKKIGPNQYFVFLTADHAVADIPKILRDQKYPVDYFPYTDTEKKISELLLSKFGQNDLILSLSNNQFFLNKKRISESSIKEIEVKEVILDYLNSMEGIATAYDGRFINNYSGSNKDIQMLAAGYNTSRSGDILLALNPGWLGKGKTESGTSHGSHYTYDTHVPLLFYGKGIKEGNSVKYHPITDLAPTLSVLLGIKFPSGATGQPIEELF